MTVNFSELYYEDGFIFRKTDNYRFSYPRASGKYYVKIVINGRTYQYHNIVWMLYNGEIPSGYTVDHVDGNKLNNKIDNLRLATPQQQTFNTRGYGRTSKYKGVDFNKKSGKWQARCYIDGITKFLGYYDTELKAKESYDEYVKNIHKEFKNDSF